MDFDPIESRRGITINAAAIPFLWVLPLTIYLLSR